MWWIYALAGASTAAISYPLLKVFIKNEKIINTIQSILFVSVMLLCREYFIPQYAVWRFESNLKREYPIYNLISVIEPDEFKRFISKEKHALLTNEDKNYISDGSKLVNKVLDKHILNASNKSLFNYLKVVTEIIKKLYMINPKYVLYIYFPTDFLQKINDDLEFENTFLPYSKIIMAAKEAIISSDIKNSSNFTSQEQEKSAELIANIMFRLIQKYGKQPVMDAFGKPTNNIEISAKIILEFNELALSSGEEGAALIQKALAVLANNQN